MSQFATQAQIIMLQKLWHAASRRLFVDGATDRERRLKWTAHTLKRAVDSWSDLDRRNDVDELKGALLAVIAPGDLSAQLRQVRGEHRRMEWQLDRLMRQLGADRNYVQGIIDQMWPTHVTSPDRERDRWQDERDQPARPRKLLDQLTAPELEKVLIALRKQSKRQRQPAEEPF